MAEVFMWTMLGILLGFTIGYTIGLKEGNRVGYVRGKISASKWSNRS
jgi:membrane protein DedA with SNARE-associated domain